MKQLNGTEQLTRRSFLKGAAAIVAGSTLAGSLGACVPPPTPTVSEAPATAGFDWKKYAGTEIYAIGNKVPYNELIYDKVAEFEEITGIKVTADVVPSGEFYQKQLLALTTTPDRVDVFFWVPASLKWKYLKEGFMEDLYPLLNDSSLTAPDFDFSDFPEAQIQSLASKDGNKLWAMPLYSGGLPFAYRKDIYEEKGLKVPTTVEEFKNNIAACHDPANEFYGVVTRGMAPWLTHTFAFAMRAFGAYYLDDEGKAAINTPEMIQAMEYYGGLLRDYGPPGAVELDDAKCNALFSQGLAAHVHLPHSHMLTFCAPDKSEVVDQVGWFTAPQGPGGGQDTSDIGGMCINSQSKKKEAAYYFVQWFCNQQNQITLMLAGEPAARKSAWESPEFKETVTEGCLADLMPTLAKIGATGDPYAHPPAEDILAARTAVTSPVTAAILGEDVKAAAEKANAEYQRLLDETGGVPLD